MHLTPRLGPQTLQWIYVIAYLLLHELYVHHKLIGNPMQLLNIKHIGTINICNTFIASQLKLTSYTFNDVNETVC